MKNLKDAILYFHVEGQPFRILSYNDDKNVQRSFPDSIQLLSMTDLDAELTRLLTMTENQKRSLCFYPNGSARVNDITEIRWHFVDIDEGGGSKDEQWERVLSAPLRPTLVYRGRAGHKVFYRVTDAYWDLNAFQQSKSHYKNVNQQLVDFFHADQAVNTPQYALRLPFTNNYKHWKEQVFTEEVILFEPENVYTQEEIAQAFPQTEKIHRPSNPVLDYSNFPEHQQVLTSFSEYMDSEGLMQIDRGDRISVQCPVHDDSTPSAVLFKDSLFFYCSSKEKCEAGGGKPLRWLVDYKKWDKMVPFFDTLEQAIHKRRYEGITLEKMGSSDYIPMETYLHSDSPHTEKILQNIHDVMNERNITVDSKSNDIYRSMINYVHSNQREIMICPLEPGGGKSTFMETLVRYHLQNDVANAGCIIVVERIETAKALARSLGKYRTKVDWNPDVPSYRFNEAAYVMESAFTSEHCKQNLTEYEFGVCRGCPELKRCPITRKYQDQQNHPIVIISHARLTMDGGGLNKYKTWRNIDGKTYERNLLIVDEKPTLISTHGLGLGDLDIFLFNVNAMAMHIDSTKVELIRKTIGQLREDIMDCLSIDRVLKPAANYSSFDIQSVWYKHYRGKNAGILNQIEYLLQNGGLVSKNSFSDLTVHFSRDHHYALEDFTTLILDGTAAHDMEYRSAQNIKVLQTPRVRDYNLLTFHAAPLTMSKSVLQSNPKLLDDIANTARNLADEQNVLVLCYKQYRHYLEEQLADEIKRGAVMVNHYGNVKGSNKYAHCTALILAGIQNKGDAYYISRFEKIYGQAAETGTLSSKHHARRFKNVDLEAFKLNDQLVYTIQDICRVAIRNRSNTSPVQVYIPTKDQVFLQLLQDYFINSKCCVWLSEQAMPNWYSKCEDLFSSLPVGHKLKKSELRSELALEGPAGKKQFQRIQKMELFSQLLAQYSITEFNARTYSKVAVQPVQKAKDMVLV
ncbi:hypothetical protein [Ectobacillus ponti]|uniref:Uncharacterized protein n=1 Tax=Ectobacillus ponti TaxID=2961894 RepID=A0AA41X9U6_9BACI|nr:hypothetical protein [Ectobacillus ponti]MCP8969000.1 hypothetical protein [Ectobacillus ponti]